MDVAVISAMAAIAGSSVGAITTFATTWLVQNNQLLSARRGAELAKRESLYANFIAEAAKRLTDSLSHQAETPEVLVQSDARSLTPTLHPTRASRSFALPS